jgi:hypothetical protein
MTRIRVNEIISIAGVLGVIGLLFLSPRAYAQDGDHGVNHAKNHSWYRELVRPDAKGSCCSDNDCRPTPARYDPRSGNWEAIKDGRWIVIPNSKIIGSELSQDIGEAHICAPPSTQTLYQPDEVFCFIPPNGGS